MYFFSETDSLVGNTNWNKTYLGKYTIHTIHYILPLYKPFRNWRLLTGLDYWNDVEQFDCRLGQSFKSKYNEPMLKIIFAEYLKIILTNNK